MYLKYMYKQKVCTEIDVDFASKSLSIFNYTKDPALCAFGINQNPTFRDFEEFLESRCIPCYRQFLRFHLRELRIDNYDPLQIIERTHGRMAEDNFWIDFGKEMDEMEKDRWRWPDDRQEEEGEELDR